MIEYIGAIEGQGWLADRSPPGYYLLSTLYVVGKLSGWIQILRRTVVYLDLASTEETRRYERYLEAIADGFTDPGLFGKAPTGQPAKSADKWIYAFQLQAIGQMMIVRRENDLRTIDFATFHRRFFKTSVEEFDRWFLPLKGLFVDLKQGEPRFNRVVGTHAILNAFIDHLDPKHLRTERQCDHLSLLGEREAAFRDKIRAIAV